MTAFRCRFFSDFVGWRRKEWHPARKAHITTDFYRVHFDFFTVIGAFEKDTGLLQVQQPGKDITQTSTNRHLS